MNERQVLTKGYHDSGEDFLALKLKKVFSILKTPGDMQLHNDMVEDMIIIVGGNGDEFRWSLAKILLNKPRDFLHSAANLIFNISLRNLSDGKKNEKGKKN